MIAQQSLFTTILIHWRLRVKYSYHLVILSVKTLHTLVFFCKFEQHFAIREKAQHINKTINIE